MASMVKSFALDGIEGFEVEIEATTIAGQQCISIIGLGDQAVKEAAERIQAAIVFAGFEVPKEKIIISLAPGDRKKRGSHYDLGMAVALLEQSGQITADNLGEYGLIGELSLNGKLRPCNGILPMVTEAKRIGIRKIIVPAGNKREASVVQGVTVHGLSDLVEVVDFLKGKRNMTTQETAVDVVSGKQNQEVLDFRDIKGQNELVDAVVLAAAGGHNLLMIGEPGCGKTMIAQRIPTILPVMTEAEALEVTKIHSISGLLKADHALMEYRPFRAPHHNISLNAMVGGGTYAQPGEVSLAHHGVLFLDELAEFSKRTLDALRQPMEDKTVTVSRVNGAHTYPANFMFVAAMNIVPRSLIQPNILVTA